MDIWKAFAQDWISPIVGLTLLSIVLNIFVFESNSRRRGINGKDGRNGKYKNGPMSEE